MVKSGHKFAFINQNLTATASRGDLSFWQMLNNTCQQVMLDFILRRQNRIVLLEIKLATSIVSQEWFHSKGGFSNLDCYTVRDWWHYDY